MFDLRNGKFNADDAAWEHLKEREIQIKWFEWLKKLQITVSAAEEIIKDGEGENQTTLQNQIT